MEPKNSTAATMLTTALIFFCLIGPAPAEIYKYQDEQGYWHFSDRPVDEYPNVIEKSPAPAEIQNNRVSEIFRLQASDKNRNVVYSTLQLDIPNSAFSLLPVEKIQSVGAMPYDDFIGGFYSIFSPHNMVLEEPIDISITCTPEAFAMYRRLNPNAKSLHLTLAVWNQDVGKYQAVDSAFENGVSRVSGKLYRLGNGWNIIVVIETSKAYMGEDLNLNSCENLQSPQNFNTTERQFWINMCYQKQAVEQIDKDICEKIQPLVNTDTNRVSKDICKLSVIIADPNSGIDDCGTLKEAAAHGKCLVHFSGKMADLTICEKIRVETQKNKCLLQIAQDNRAVAVCEKISDRLSRQGCFKSVAFAEGNPEICKLVSDEPTIIKAFCYQGLAEKLKEPKLCDQVLPVLTAEAKAECVQRASAD